MNPYTTLRVIAILDKVGWPHSFSLHRTLTLDEEVSVPVLRNHLRQVLEKKGVRIETSFQGKSGCVPFYHVGRELRNDDGYYEGDGGRDWLCIQDGKLLWHNLQGSKGVDDLHRTPCPENIDLQTFYCYDEALLSGCEGGE